MMITIRFNHVVVAEIDSEAEEVEAEVEEEEVEEETSYTQEIQAEIVPM
jgi:hypothetical protein